MLLPSLLAAALAAEPPPDLPEIGRVAEAAVKGVTTFPGCAAFEGELVQTNRFAGAATTERFAWTGELTEAGWRPWRVRQESPAQDGVSVSTSGGGVSYPFVVPLLGAMLPAPAEWMRTYAATGGLAPMGTPGVTAGVAAAEGVGEGVPAAEGVPVATPGTPSTNTGDDGADLAGETRQILLDLLAAASTAVELETVEPVRDAATPTIRYLRSFSSRRTLFGRKENLVDVRLDATTLRPHTWSIQLDDPVRVDGRPGRIVRMALTLETDAEGWPVRDALDATGAWGPFALRVERTITFRRVGACGTAG